MRANQQSQFTQSLPYIASLKAALSPLFLPFYICQRHPSTSCCTSKSFSISGRHCNLGAGSRYSQYQPYVAKIPASNAKFSQRNVIKDTSISIYEQRLKVTKSIKFLGGRIDNHNMKLHVEHTERASLIGRMRIAKFKFNPCYPINPFL